MTERTPSTKMAPSPVRDNVERIRRRLKEGWVAPVARHVGFRLVEIGRGHARIVLEAGPQHANPMGTLHGGILCDIADAAMGMSYASLLLPSESFTTIELKINFLRPFWSGNLSARGRIIRKGRTMGLLECRVTDDHRRLVAYATSTCVSIPGAPGEGLTRTQGTGRNPTMRQATVKG